MPCDTHYLFIERGSALLSPSSLRPARTAAQPGSLPYASCDPSGSSLVSLASKVRGLPRSSLSPSFNFQRPPPSPFH